MGCRQACRFKVKKVICCACLRPEGAAYFGIQVSPSLSVPCKCCCHVFWKTPASHTVIGMYKHFPPPPLRSPAVTPAAAWPSKVDSFCFLRGYNASSFPCPCVTVPEASIKKKTFHEHYIHVGFRAGNARPMTERNKKTRSLFSSCFSYRVQRSVVKTLFLDWRVRILIMD